MPRIAILFGHQRSGTNVTVWALDKSLEVTLFNEDNPDVFKNFNLIRPEIIGDISRTVTTKIALFKPVSNTRDIFQLGWIYPRARCILAFRDYPEVHRSFVELFGERGERALRNRLNRGIFDPMVDLFRDIERTFDARNVSFADLFMLSWCYNTRLMLDFFRSQPDRCVASPYEALISSPDKALRKICDLLGIAYVPSMSEGICSRSPPASLPDANPAFLEFADRLYSEVSAACPADSNPASR